MIFHVSLSFLIALIACRLAIMGQYTQGPNQVKPDMRTDRTEERGLGKLALDWDTIKEATLSTPEVVLKPY